MQTNKIRHKKALGGFQNSYVPIRLMEHKDIGRFVLLHKYGRVTWGRVLSFNNDYDIAAIVYSCHGYWNKWRSYSAQWNDYNQISWAPEGDAELPDDGLPEDHDANDEESEQS